MSNLGFGLGERGVKGFVARHLEKMVLGLAIAMAALFFCAGYGVETIPDANTPSGLRRIAENAESHVHSEGVWEALRQDRQNTLDHSRRVAEGRVGVTSTNFPITRITWPLFKMQAQRSDPELYPPIKVEANGDLLMVALSSHDYGAGPLDDVIRSDEFEDQKRLAAEAIEREREEAKERRRGRGGAGGDDGYLDDEEEECDDEDDECDECEDLLDEDDEDDDEEEDEEDYLVSPSFIDTLGGVNPGTGTPFRGFYVVAVKAVVPYQKQWQEFDYRLANALGYDPGMDMPQYVWFAVQRAEVPPGFDPDDADATDKLVWNDIANTVSETERAKKWVDASPEVVDVAFVDEALTMPIPPVLLADITPFALHSDVPRQRYEIVIEDDEPEIKIDIETIKKLRPGQPTGTGGNRINPYLVMTDGEDEDEDEEEEEEDEDEEEEEYTTYGRVGLEEGAIPRYKLIRFFDFRAEWGKSYRYRVQVWLRDPNNPFGQGVALSGADTIARSSQAARQNALPDTILDKDVLARLTAQMNDEKDKPDEQKTFWRITDWSEPSPTVTTPTKVERFFASTVTPGKSIGIKVDNPANPEFRFLLSEPSGQVLSLIWEDYYSTNIPGQVEVFRGSVLNFEMDVDVFHPVARDFRRLEQHKFQTDAIVLDIRGGEPLPGSTKDDPKLMPGEFLLIDADGNLQVHHELDELESYRRALFIEDKLNEPAVSSTDPLASTR